MDRRNMLKVLPLAALAGVSLKVEGVDAKAFEMKPNKKYLFAMPNAPADFAQHAATTLRKRGIDATVYTGDELKIYEIEESFAAK